MWSRRARNAAGLQKVQRTEGLQHTWLIIDTPGGITAPSAFDKQRILSALKSWHCTRGLCHVCTCWCAWHTATLTHITACAHRHTHALAHTSTQPLIPGIACLEPMLVHQRPGSASQPSSKGQPRMLVTGSAHVCEEELQHLPRLLSCPRPPA